MSTSPSLDRILQQPGTGPTCLACGGRLGLYVVAGEYHRLCAACTRDRIEAHSPDPKQWPPWLSTLYNEVVTEIQHQEQRSSQALTVQWDLTTCDRCARTMPLNEARYLLPKVPLEGPAGGPLVPAKRLPDGTVIVGGAGGQQVIVRPLCATCYNIAAPRPAT